MKKVIMILITFVFAFVINEVIVRFVIGYPTYGLEMKVIGIRSPYSASVLQNLFKAHSNYWNVEGGNVIEGRNNYGLPGEDINLNDSSKIIYLLGDSYLEGLQVKRNKMAVSIFQELLNSKELNFSVINLAYSGHDPYDLYYRIKYFEKSIGKGYVILVLQNDKYEWLNRHREINLNLENNTVVENNGINYKISKFLRNNFASFNLYRYLFVKGKEEENDIIKRDGVKDSTERNFNRLDSVLTQYKKDYGNKFLLVSMSSDSLLNNHLERLSNDSKISYYQKDLISTDLRFSGKGHLNEKGNQELGKFLFDSFKKYLKND